MPTESSNQGGTATLFSSFNRSIMAITVLALSVFLPTLAAFATTPVDEKPAGSGLFPNVELPYKDYGTVSFLDDGTLVIEFGGNLIRDPQCADKIYVNHHWAFVVPLDTDGLTLVRTGDRWLLDQKGAQTKALGLAKKDVSARIVFPNPLPRGRDGAARECLFDLTGELTVDFNEASGIGRLLVRDQRDDSPRNGEEFDMPFRAVEPAALQDEGERPETCACTVSCRDGECSISCTAPKVCACWCDSGHDPKCVCAENPPREIELFP